MSKNPSTNLKRTRSRDLEVLFIAVTIAVVDYMSEAE